ncbi:MAG: hypothetical protein H7A25_16675 [Leptospiraceae bacterium]|nr:hypothetical protein [Leptospiraceae bacterium]MCP5501539.1 hypothetical protein [Leptospiraceae bacterium]
MKLQIFSIYFMFLFTFLFYPIQAKDSKEQILHEAIIRESSLSRKKTLGEKLGNLKTPEAADVTIKLLSDTSYWNREAGVSACMVLKMEKTDNLLIQKMLSDHMIKSSIQTIVSKEPNRYLLYMIENYKDSYRKKDREELIQLIAKTKHKYAKDFLLKLIEKAGSPDRSVALTYLGKYFSKESYSFIRQQINEKELRLSVLSYLIEFDNKKDYPIFTDILKNSNSPVEEKIISLKALEHWGTQEEKYSEYVKVLEAEEESLKIGAMQIFKDLRNTRIQLLLCKQMKIARKQSTRVIAAKTLMEFRDKSIVPYLILGLKEKYSRQKSGSILGNLFMNMITLGFAGTFKELSYQMDENKFSKHKEKLSLKLKELTGRDYGTSYRNWKDWAIYSGYTVDGNNIIQILYSAYPKERAKAIENAILLLGYKTKYKFLDKYGKIGELETIKILTEELIEKGYLQDEDY